MPLPRPPWKRWSAAAAWSLPALAVMAQALHLHLINAGPQGPGLPIDDAYIFQRYAQNLAAGMGFAFNPHETSFGCTSLLWPLLMALVTKVAPWAPYPAAALWTGALLMAASAAGAAAIVIKKTESAALGLLTGLLVSASPLLLLNAVSGMETPLTMALLAALAWVMLGEDYHPYRAGLLAGLLTLNRPEALYFAPALIAAFGLQRMRPWVKLRFRAVLKFLLMWAVLVLPAAALIYHHTGSVLPTTFMGKIMSASPGVIERGVLERVFSAALSLASGWFELAKRLRVLSALIAGAIVVQTIHDLWSLRRNQPSPWPLAGSLVLAGFLLLPAAYGFSFPVGPPFGGYYLRYIAPILVVAAILAGLGLDLISRFAATRWSWTERRREIALLVLLALAGSYQGWLWSFQYRYGVEDFRREVSLNQGLRMEAAKWIADPDHVPPTDRVLAGYTGLGVVGGNCGRYILDQGALINPDIFDYYRDAKRSPAGQWQAAVQYMLDRNLTWYVTFAFPPEYADKIADPAATPGFTEMARIGDLTEPPKPLAQVRIYRFDHGAYQAEWGRTGR